MPYKAREVFKEPENPSVKIWRYMDLSKFIDLIVTESLYFSLCHQFKDDPFEGSYPQLSKEAIKKEFKQARNEKPDIAKSIDYFEQYREKRFREFRKHAGINCWHKNEQESAAMWKLYLKSNEGIAIQSTFERLKCSFKNCKEIIHIGEVTYLNYDTDCINTSNVWARFLCKRKSFLYENELRAMTNLREVPFWEMKSKQGGKIKVDLNELIEKIYIAPNASQQMKKNIELIIEKFHFNFPVIHSDMDKDPIL